MVQTRILVTSEPDGGLQPFRHESLDVTFHLYTVGGAPILLDGMAWAFVDWTPPQISGLEVCRRLRCDPLTSQVHVTMVLEGDDPDQRKQALRAGADDYAVGPLTRGMILDRVMATLQPELREINPALTFGNLSIDVAGFEARWGNKRLALMPNEFRLLRFFAERPGRVFTRSQLIAALGKHDMPLDERTVDVWIGRLRKALRAAGAGEPLRTVRSLGYVYDQS